MATRHRILTSSDELRDALGCRFDILCGSAVSGGALGLPMVARATSVFYNALAMDLRERSGAAGSSSRYALLLASHYAASLARDSGGHSATRLSTKFEEWLGIVEDACTTERRLSAEARNGIGPLLHAMFWCGANQCATNHRSIASLYEMGVVHRVFTTNFDNALERASVQLQRERIIAAENAVSYDGRALYKLHGDAEEMSFGVLNLEEMDVARTGELFGELDGLGRDRPLLVVGYGGSGDIDISPHIRLAVSSGNTVIWGVHPRDLGRQHPFDGVTAFPTDLFSDDPSENWIIALSQAFGGTTCLCPTSRVAWIPRLQQWVHERSIGELLETLWGSLRSKSDWAALHLFSVCRDLKCWNGVAGSRGELRAQQMAVGVGACRSAVVGCEQLLNSGTTLSAAVQVGVHQELAFAKWRLGADADALAVLSPYLRLANHDTVSIRCVVTYVAICAELLERTVVSARARKLFEAIEVPVAAGVVRGNEHLLLLRERLTACSAIARCYAAGCSPSSDARRLLPDELGLLAWDANQAEALRHLAAALRAMGDARWRDLERKAQSLEPHRRSRRLGGGIVPVLRAIRTTIREWQYRRSQRLVAGWIQQDRDLLLDSDRVLRIALRVVDANRALDNRIKLLVFRCTRARRARNARKRDRYRAL